MGKELKCNLKLNIAEDKTDNVYNPALRNQIQPREYQLSKRIVHEIKFGDIAVMYLSNFPYSDRYLNTDWQIEMF